MSSGFTIGDLVYWFIGVTKCEGEVVDVHVRKKNASFPGKFSGKETATENVLLVQIRDGRKVLKLESEVMLENNKRRFA